MVPILLPNFKFKLFFIDLGFNILIPFPIPTLNVFQYASMLNSFAPSSNWVKLGRSNVVEPLLKKPKKSYDKHKVFQDTWATRFPWVQLVLGSTSQYKLFDTKTLSEVYCSTIGKKDKFFPRKLDTLQKHVGCHKTIVATLMLLLMNGLTTNTHPITRTRGFT